MPVRIEKDAMRYHLPVKLLTGVSAGLVLAALAYFFWTKSSGNDVASASGSPGTPLEQRPVVAVLLCRQLWRGTAGHH
jgi:hypothetical protein